MPFLLSDDFFQNQLFRKRVVGPDLGPSVGKELMPDLNC